MVESNNTEVTECSDQDIDGHIEGHKLGVFHVLEEEGEFFIVLHLRSHLVEEEG
jgi:hypothetical protein